VPEAGSTALFVSDLHLSPERPSITEAFFGFLRVEARCAGSLFILGDLFDYWVGDDDLDAPFAASIAAALAALAQSGCSVSLMQGNRDFLMGEHLASAAHAILLPDPTLIELSGASTLLLHGDTLCIDDPDYQNFRAKVRTEHWQDDFLAKPLAERRAIALGLRADSRSSQKAKPEAIMDVAERAVVATFRRYDCDRMIHGHTHRPARHQHRIDGRTRERWVLADWYNRGSYLRCDANGACASMLLGAP
jgi:UDP-2,3-diacylglucosamine hydrolase